jgi:hypothetical protein
MILLVKEHIILISYIACLTEHKIVSYILIQNISILFSKEEVQVEFYFLYNIKANQWEIIWEEDLVVIKVDLVEIKEDLVEIKVIKDGVETNQEIKDGEEISKETNKVDGEEIKVDLDNNSNQIMGGAIMEVSEDSKIMVGEIIMAGDF